MGSCEVTGTTYPPGHPRGVRALTHRDGRLTAQPYTGTHDPPYRPQGASADAAPDYRTVVPRAELDVEAALDVVRPICDAVRHRGVEAITEFAARFDRVEQTDIRVPRAALTEALDALEPAVRAALEESIRRLRITCEAELEADVVTEVVPGGTVTQRMVPVERVGLYVPGGLAPLVSSVVMNVVPAQVAGVARSRSPPAGVQRRPAAPDHPRGLRAARGGRGLRRGRCAGGRDVRVRRRPCRPVDLVTGPGNIYTVSAKRLLKGVVGIDSEAGPTEIAILADDTAVPAHVAADLISQAEHDPLASSVLVTPSERLAGEVEAELDKQVSVTRHVERVRTALGGRQSAIVLVEDLEQGLAVVNGYAAEHLEIQTEDAGRWAGRVRNAGAVFVGAFAPVSLGDYAAGSNHVLPTAGCACHSSACPCGPSARPCTSSSTPTPRCATSPTT